MARRRRRRKSDSAGPAPASTSSSSSPTKVRGAEEARSRAIEMVLKRTLEQLASGSYKGAKRSRLTTDWSTNAGDADSNTLDDLPLLRERSRELCRNDGLARSAVDSYVSNVVGRGMVPQVQIRAERLGLTEEEALEYAEIVEDRFAAWSRGSDSHNRLSFAGQQALVFRQRLENGDVFSVPVMLEEPWREASLAIEVIEADRVSDPNYSRSDPRIRGGVELGSRGQPVAYWVRRKHPGDERDVRNGHRWTRVRARLANGRPSMLHHYLPTRPGQSRGVPLLAPVLREFNDRRSYLEAERVAARAAAAISMIIQTTDPLGAMQEATAPKTGLVEELEPGIIQYLAPGEEMKGFIPNRPNSAFEQFLEALERSIGCGVNLSYGSLTKNTSKSNFSNAKTELMSDRRVFRAEQEWLAQSFCQPYLELFIEELFLRGELPWIRSIDDFDAFRSDWCRAEWIPDGWDWLDPLKDVQATVTAIDAGIESRTRAMKSRGLDPERIADDLRREREANPAPTSSNDDQAEPATVPVMEDDDADDGTGDDDADE